MVTSAYAVAQNRQVLLFSRLYKPCTNLFMRGKPHTRVRAHAKKQNKKPHDHVTIQTKKGSEKPPYGYSGISFRRGCFISIGYISIYQLVRYVYTKGNVWCEPQSKQQRSRKKKSPKISFPCPVSSALLPANSSREHGT